MMKIVEKEGIIPSKRQVWKEIYVHNSSKGCVQLRIKSNILIE
jgi:hypothetical protein